MPYKKTLKDKLVLLAEIQTNISAATSEVEMVQEEVSKQHKSVADTITTLSSNFREPVAWQGISMEAEAWNPLSRIWN